MEYTLVILAAGNATRYGGNKQIDPVGPTGEFIMDYSIYDAINAGFNKILFIIKKEDEEIFQKTVFKRLEGKIKYDYVFQDLNNLPEGYALPNRTTPLGTAHAIFCAKDKIKGPFSVINADDFYGSEAYEKLINFLQNNKTRTSYLTICYKVKDTIQEKPVKRGVTTIKNGIVERIIESKIYKENDMLLARPLDGTPAFQVMDSDLASVNLFGLTPSFIKEINLRFPKFLDKLDNDTSEYQIPEVINDAIKDKTITVYAETVNDEWIGMTYKDEKEEVINHITKLIKDGKYPKNLWL